MAQALVTGSGIAGIASAIRLAVKGWDVKVFEANAYAGGKLSELRTGNYRFDAGPSLFTMPQYVDELFRLAGKDPRDYFSYRKLDPLCHYFYEDGTRLSSWADNKQFAKEIAAKTLDSEQSVLKFLERSAGIYAVTNHVFLEKSLHRLKTYLNYDTFKSFLQLGKIDSMRSMNTANESFFKDGRTIQLFNRYATYNGSNPYKAPATLNVIPHLEQNMGAYFPEGGMYVITKSLVRLATEIGVQFYYNSPVEEIVVKDKKAVGLNVKGVFHEAELVISNTDVWFAYKSLLPREKPPLRILNQERSSSALIFYWGIKKEFSELGLHNIFFSKDYRKEFDGIWKDKSIPADPTVYINISSKMNISDAPAGHENWFVMINVPSNCGQDWDLLIEQARENILNKLNRILSLELRDFISCEDILDPRSIEYKTASYQGALYGTSSNNRYAAFLRHSNASSSVKGLYFTGGSVHPGGGIPLSLLSAKIVSDLLDDELKA